MPFTAHDLRYHAEKTYPALYAHLNWQAQRSLDVLKFDPVEVDLVVGHVVEHLLRLGLLGGVDKTPLTVLDGLSNAQFYAFLNRSIRNKAIDRLRRRRLPITYATDIEGTEGTDTEEDVLNEATENLGGGAPFATPEQATYALASQLELRNLLKRCIKALSAAPKQFQAIMQEIEEFDATALLQGIIEELPDKNLLARSGETIANISQHKDHAHKKLRHCLQQQSSNLTVIVALRLTEYRVQSTHSDEFVVDVQTIAQEGLTESDVSEGLKQLVAEGLLDWQGDTVVHITSTQMKQLMRFFRED
jgi:DNA-directed RNA polymerase specialized sigma24 family protein